MKKFYIFLLILAFYCSAKAQNNRFDVNLDSEVNITDVTTLVNRILSGQGYDAQYDVFEDGQINVVDVTSLVDYILGKGPADNRRHAFVDLGLPSGTLWATCNMGADTPIDAGDYYSWGELQPKTNYSRSNYQYYVNSQYQSLGQEISGTSFDAARQSWGGTWRLPTFDEMNELMTCTWQAQIINSVSGYMVTGPNGNSIFLPSAGYCSSSNGPVDVGTDGYYWTGTQVSGRVGSAYSISTTDIGEVWWTSRYFGFPIRPVR